MTRISTFIVALLLTAFSAAPAHSVNDLAIDHTPAVIFADKEEGPQVIIGAPDEVKIGEMIIIDLRDSLGEGIDMKIIPEPKQVRVFKEGKVICASTGNITTAYLFIFSCSMDGQTDVKTHIVNVKGAQVVAPNNPAIIVRPGDNLPQKVAMWCQVVQSPTLRDDTLKLAQSFASISAIINTGAFADVGEISDAINTSNHDALGDNLQNWLPMLSSLNKELQAMTDASLLDDMESHAKLWEKVSQGLLMYAETLN